MIVPHSRLARRRAPLRGRLKHAGMATRATRPRTYPPFAAFLVHSNEEASSLSLGARAARNLPCPSADQATRRAAINTSDESEISHGAQAHAFTGSQSACLRAASRDSAGLRGEAAAASRDDGIAAIYVSRFVWT